MQTHTSTPAPAPAWEAPRVVDGSAALETVGMIFALTLWAACFFQLALGGPARYWTQERIDETTR